MDIKKVKPRLYVRTNTVLDRTTNIALGDQHLALRKPETTGMILRKVTGHGDKVWWVRHMNGDIAPYQPHEFERTYHTGS